MRPVYIVPPPWWLPEQLGLMDWAYPLAGLVVDFAVGLAGSAGRADDAAAAYRRVPDGLLRPLLAGMLLLIGARLVLSPA